MSSQATAPIAAPRAPDGTHSQRKAASLAIALPGGLFWIAMAFADGPIYLAMERLKIAGHLLFILPFIAAFLVWSLVVVRAVLTPGTLVRQAALLGAFGLYWIAQLLIVGDFRLDAYLQLYAMIALVILFTDLHRDNADRMRNAFGDSLIVAHYLLCAYCILSWAMLNLGGPSIDWDYGRVIGASSPKRFLGYLRVAGLHREPAWAALAISTTFLATYLHSRRQMIPAFVALSGAALATGSATAILFAGVIAAHQMMIQRNFGGVVKGAVLVLTLLVVGYAFTDRLGRILSGTDASLAMRLASLQVGLNVIQQSFPWGTGYGNFRSFALYNPDLWSTFVDLRRAYFYKTDVAWLNLVAELGVFGIALLVAVIWNFARSRSVLVLVVYAFATLGTGSLIVPYFLALGALAGLEAARSTTDARDRGGYFAQPSARRWAR